jgi:hypothetical protein
MNFTAVGIIVFIIIFLIGSDKNINNVMLILTIIGAIVSFGIVVCLLKSQIKHQKINKAGGTDINKWIKKTITIYRGNNIGMERPSGFISEAEGNGISNKFKFIGIFSDKSIMYYNYDKFQIGNYVYVRDMHNIHLYHAHHILNDNITAYYLKDSVDLTDKHEHALPQKKDTIISEFTIYYNRDMGDITTKPINPKGFKFLYYDDKEEYYYYNSNNQINNWPFQIENYLYVKNDKKEYYNGIICDCKAFYIPSKSLSSFIGEIYSKVYNLTTYYYN